MPEPAPVPLFERLLGASFEGLPAPIKRVHDGQARKVLSGRCRITRGTGVLARLLARVASLPEAGDDLPVRVLFQRDERSEIWSRDFAGQPMRSTLTERDGRLEETLGPVRFRFALSTDDGAIVWNVVAIRVLGLPLPAAWFKAVHARQSVEAGRYTFDVRVELPWIGLLVHYYGWLDSSSGQDEAVASLTPAPAKGGAGSIGTDQWMRPRSGMQSAGSPRAYARLHGHIPQAGPCSTFRRASPGGRGE